MSSKIALYFSILDTRVPKNTVQLIYICMHKESISTLPPINSRNKESFFGCNEVIKFSGDQIK